MLVVVVFDALDRNYSKCKGSINIIKPLLSTFLKPAIQLINCSITKTYYRGHIAYWWPLCFTPSGPRFDSQPRHFQQNYYS